MKRLLLSSSIVALVVYLLWPYVTLYLLDRAIGAADEIALEQLVDWAAVQDGLRDDMNAALGQALRDGEGPVEGALAGALAALIGPGIIDRLVESYVAPSGLAMMLRSEQPNGSAGGDAEHKTPRLIEQVDYAFFAGPTTFRVRLKPPDANEQVTALLRFRDLDWRRTRAFLPLDALGPAASAAPTGGS